MWAATTSARTAPRRWRVRLVLRTPPLLLLLGVGLAPARPRNAAAGRCASPLPASCALPGPCSCLSTPRSWRAAWREFNPPPPLPAAALKGNEELRSLELSYNPMGPEGAQAFADIIKYDMKVRRYSLFPGWYHWAGQQGGWCLGAPALRRAGAAVPRVPLNPACLPPCLPAPAGFPCSPACLPRCSWRCWAWAGARWAAGMVSRPWPTC